jgi:hypothetical protein
MILSSSLDLKLKTRGKDHENPTYLPSLFLFGGKMRNLRTGTPFPLLVT